jgi:hypothetical protein
MSEYERKRVDWAGYQRGLFTLTEYGLVSMAGLLGDYEAQHTEGMDADELHEYYQYAQGVFDELERRGLLLDEPPAEPAIGTYSFPWEKPDTDVIWSGPPRPPRHDDPPIELDDWDKYGTIGGGYSKVGNVSSGRKVPKKWVADLDEEQLGIYRREPGEH